MAHGAVYIRLMNSSKWREIRARQLYKMPTCEICLSHRVVRSADVVHHVVEVETGRSEEEQMRLAYAETTYETDEHGQIVYGENGAPIRLSGNLASLCRKCHNKIHTEMKSHSKKVHQERSRSRLEAWKESVRGNGRSE